MMKNEELNLKMLPEADWLNLKGQVLTKFQDVFGLQTKEDQAGFDELVKTADPEDVREKLSMAFWYGVVEAGWMPEMFADADPDSPEFDAIETYVAAAQVKACEQLNIDPEIME